MEEAAIERFDVSFFDSPEVLELIPAERLVRLGIKLRMQRLPSIEDHIGDLADNADLDEDPEQHFEKVASAMDWLEKLDIDLDGADLIGAGRQKIVDSVKRLTERKEERDSEAEDDSDWTHIVTASENSMSPTRPTSDASTRSIFDDVDQ